MILMTRSSLRWMWRTLKISPMPPMPRRSRIWYLPSRSFDEYVRWNTVTRSPHAGHCSRLMSIGCLQRRQLIWVMSAPRLRDLATSSMVSQNIAARRVGAEAHHVSRLQHRFVDARVVDIRSVGGLQIFERERVAGHGDAGVAARDGRMREHDRAGAVAADHDAVAAQRVLFVRFGLHVDELPLRRCVGRRNGCRNRPHGRCVAGAEVVLLERLEK